MSTQDAIETNKNIPKMLDIYTRTFASFIPEGKTWSDLTPEEQEEVKNKYRFTAMRPGQYQNLSGINNPG